MKQTLLIFALLLPLLAAKEIPIAESGHWQEPYFHKLKPRFKYVNLSRFTNEKPGYQHEVKLPKADSVTYRKLFKQSRIFTSYGDQPALYYAFYFSTKVILSKSTSRVISRLRWSMSALNGTGP